MEHDTGTAGSGNEPASECFDRWQGDTAETLRRAETARIEVYVRSLLPPPGAKESQQRVIDDLQHAVEGTPVEDVLVEVWGERLCLCESCRDSNVGRRLLGRVDSIEDWGGAYDASVERFFERTDAESTMTGNTYEGIVPPRVTAALWVDGSVAGVFPCEFGDVCYSVDDFVATLRGLTVSTELAGQLESSG